MGIPLAIEASRALGLDDYVILHKTPKIHLGETWAEPVYSITTDKPQRLRMDPARVDAVRGRRVAVVDDVISTGASLSVGAAPGPPDGGGAGRHRDAHDRGRRLEACAGRGRGPGPHASAAMPLFHPDGSGGLVEDWD